MSNSPGTLYEALTTDGQVPSGSFHATDKTVALDTLVHASFLGGRLAELRGRSVLIATREQLPAALAMVELDGVARRMVLCPPDLEHKHFAHVVANARIDAFVRDGSGPDPTSFGIGTSVEITTVATQAAIDRSATEETEWILLTSGTTGAPKLVQHSLLTLSGALGRLRANEQGAVWSTFYDIRRYGGLQIFLRAVVGEDSLVLSSAHEPPREFLSRAGRCHVTHISGTPSHWRRALMSGGAQNISPRYVRLSGEIADQAILDALRAAYPHANVAHAFASTEAGVAFDVDDGLAGFPVDLIGRHDSDVEMKVENGTLRIRSSRNAARYLRADGVTPVVGCDGFVDTHDIVELRNSRCHFIGREGGVINVGGSKVYPEEVEAVINVHPQVQISLVRARNNPITGAVVVADVVLRDPETERNVTDAIAREILDTCRRALQLYKVPATVRFVDALELSDAGKLVRSDA